MLSMIYAPTDGTPIWASIPGYGELVVIAWLDGFLDDEGRDCGSWVTVDEGQEPPPSWDDGVCWERNSNGEKSVEPDGWMPM